MSKLESTLQRWRREAETIITPSPTRSDLKQTNKQHAHQNEIIIYIEHLHVHVQRSYKEGDKYYVHMSRQSN